MNQLARFMQNPGPEHWKAALRVLQYLKGAIKNRLWFNSNSKGVSLTAYSDANHAGCVDTRRSTSGYICKVNGTAVAWQSKRQNCIALSSCESEYVALSACGTQVVWMRRLLEELGFPQQHTTPILSDNEAAKRLIENPVQHDRTKHIDNRYHWIRKEQEDGSLVVVWLPTADEEADILTKEYSSSFSRLRDLAMGRTERRKAESDGRESGGSGKEEREQAKQQDKKIANKAPNSALKPTTTAHTTPNIKPTKKSLTWSTTAPTTPTSAAKPTEMPTKEALHAEKHANKIH